MPPRIEVPSLSGNDSGATPTWQSELHRLNADSDFVNAAYSSMSGDGTGLRLPNFLLASGEPPHALEKMHPPAGGQQDRYPGKLTYAQIFIPEVEPVSPVEPPKPPEIGPAREQIVITPPTAGGPRAHSNDRRDKQPESTKGPPPQ
jgi:hypothetical protein